MSKYQALIDALKAGPTDGPWFEHHDKGHLYIENYRDDVVCDIGRGAQSCPTSRYIAACQPDTISSLLADLERAEKDAERYRWLRATENANRDEWNLFGPYSSPAEIDAAIDAALSQLKGVQ